MNTDANIDEPVEPEVHVGVGRVLGKDVRARATLSAVITRADGTIEDLGVIAESEEE